MAKTIVECMEEEVKDIADMYQDEKDMVITKEDDACFKASTRCHICDDELGIDKVRHHDHLTGKFNFVNFTDAFTSWLTVME